MAAFVPQEAGVCETPVAVAKPAEKPTAKPNANRATADAARCSGDGGARNRTEQDEETEHSLFQELRYADFDEAMLRKHLCEYPWTPEGRKVLAALPLNTHTAKEAVLFHTCPGPALDRSSYMHLQVYNVDRDGVPNYVEVDTHDKTMSRAIESWEKMRRMNKTRPEQQIVGRITYFILQSDAKAKADVNQNRSGAVAHLLCSATLDCQ